MKCRILLLVGLLLVGAIVTGCAQAEATLAPDYSFAAIDKIAVLDVTGDVAGAATRDLICDYFGMEFMKKGYGVIERQRIQALLDEQRFQRSDLTTQQGAARAGKILNVPVVVVAAVYVYGQKISMTAKMIDVETANVVWIASGDGNTGRTLATIGGAVAGAGVGVAVGGDRTGRTVGGVAGAAVGGAAGYLLTPDVDKVLRKVIKKIGATLPNR